MRRSRQDERRKTISRLTAVPGAPAALKYAVDFYKAKALDVLSSWGGTLEASGCVFEVHRSQDSVPSWGRLCQRWHRAGRRPAVTENGFYVIYALLPA